MFQCFQKACELSQQQLNLDIYPFIIYCLGKDEMELIVGKKPIEPRIQTITHNTKVTNRKQTKRSRKPQRLVQNEVS